MHAALLEVANLANEATYRSVHEMWRTKKDRDLPRRTAAVALGALLRSERLRKPIYSRIENTFPGYKFYRGGGEQIVLASDKSILKVLVNTHARRGETPEELAAKLQTYTDTCERFLGSVWVPTSYETVKVPWSKQALVVAHQPLIDAERSYETFEDMVDDPLVSHKTKEEFGASMAALHINTGLRPDILGRNNILAVRGDNGARELRFPDTIPVDEIGQERIWPTHNITVAERMEAKLALLSLDQTVGEAA